jgi:apolipoprotein N-acyltransferase
MTERDVLDYRPGGARSARALKPPFIDRWYGRLTLLLLSVAMLTFSFAPFYQVYLAWIGLVPWLLVLRRIRSQWKAFFWFWLAGIAFFIANMWWLVYVTAPGMVALMALLGLFWGVAAVVIRGLRLLDPYSRADPTATIEVAEPQPKVWRVTAAVLLIPAVWVSLEWVRGNYPFNGLPWLFLGQSQSPSATLLLCQIADITGVYGVSFWVASVNVLIALAIIHRHRLSRVVPAGVIVIGMTLGIVAYGLYRLSEQTTEPGPTVTVVQSNYPQSNSGEKGAEITEIVDFHLSTTEKELARVGKGNSDLVVWSETMMPPLNPEALPMVEPRYALLFEQTARRIARLAASDDIAILAGGAYMSERQQQGKYVTDRRNVAYFYAPTGVLSPRRYDKIHLVPFGEYLPFKETLPPLYSLFIRLGPQYMEEYVLQPGHEDQLTVFEIGPRGGAGNVNWRFVTPICFEDIDPNLVARMFRGRDGTKRADFIVNITNDGWFKGSEMPQHLQCAVFRSIENRVPTARSVNTGISGYIDSSGRPINLIGVGEKGARTALLHLDGRYTLYTRFGDVFAIACVGATAVMSLVALVRWWGRRGAVRAARKQSAG